VQRVCGKMRAGHTLAIIGPMLDERVINPPTFEPWRDFLRWERMRGYRDGVQQHCSPFVIQNLKWVSESSSADGARLSVRDVELLFRGIPSLRAVLTAFPRTVNYVLQAAETVLGDASAVHVTTYDETAAIQQYWRRGAVAAYQRTQRTDFNFGLVPRLVSLIPALLQWSLRPDPTATTALGGGTIGYFSTLPQVITTPTFLVTDTMTVDLRAMLLEDIDPAEPPMHGANTLVNVSFYVHFLELYMQAAEFRIITRVEATWVDSRLRWDERWDHPQLRLPLGSIWSPVIVGRADKKVEIISEELTVSSAGVVSYSKEIDVKGACAYVFDEYPSDSQSCRYGMRTNTPGADIHAATSTVSGAFIPPAEYKRLRFYMIDPFVRLPNEHETNGAPEVGTAVTLGFSLKRTPTFVLYPIIMPSILVVLITLLMFALVSTEDRVATGVTALLLLFVLRDSTDNLIPSYAGSTWLNAWLLFNMVFIVVTVIIFVTNLDSLVVREILLCTGYGEEADRAALLTKMRAHRARKYHTPWHMALHMQQHSGPHHPLQTMENVVHEMQEHDRASGTRTTSKLRMRRMSASVPPRLSTPPSPPTDSDVAVKRRGTGPWVWPDVEDVSKQALPLESVERIPAQLRRLPSQVLQEAKDIEQNLTEKSERLAAEFEDVSTQALQSVERIPAQLQEVEVLQEVEDSKQDLTEKSVILHAMASKSTEDFIDYFSACVFGVGYAICCASYLSQLDWVAEGNE